MKKSAWRQYIKDVYHLEIASKLRRARKRLHPMEFSYHCEQIFRASRTIRYIESLDSDDVNVGAVLTKSHIKTTIQEIRSAHHETNEYVLRDSGIVEVLEVHMTEILSELEVSDLPREDIEALRRAGSADPKAELRVRLHRIRAHFAREQRQRDRMSLSSTITEASQQLDRKLQELEEPDDGPNRRPKAIAEPETKKKWFKGIGSIARGTVLTGVDVSLLAGGWSLPLSPDTTIVGSVASIVTGLGDIAIGVGELRGE
jgi:hypothetical protein